MLNLLAPLSLVRGGFYFYESGMVFILGIGYYWYNNLHSTGAEYLKIYETLVYTIDSSNPGVGYSLRCLGC